MELNAPLVRPNSGPSTRIPWYPLVSTNYGRAIGGITRYPCAGIRPPWRAGQIEGPSGASPGIPGDSAKPNGINRLAGLKSTRASISRTFPATGTSTPGSPFTTDFSHGDSPHLTLIKRLPPSPLPANLTDVAPPCHPQTMPSHGVPHGHRTRTREAQSNQSLPASFRRRACSPLVIEPG